MAPFRMPFTNRKGPITNGLEANDENARPGSNGTHAPMGSRTGKDSVILGSRPAPLEPTEYKMSCQLQERAQLGPFALRLTTLTYLIAVNDSGIYLPVHLPRRRVSEVD
jgi:hypothetical protein